MKILKIDHLGLAVNEMKEAGKFWRQVMGLPITSSETVESQQVTTGFIPVGESEIELLESTRNRAPVRAARGLPSCIPRLRAACWWNCVNESIAAADSSPAP